MPKQWRPVALSEQVSAQKPFGASCEGVAIALFRDKGGAVRALRDECAHRRAPLSLGQVNAEGFIACPYHGWRYDGKTGACVVIPNLSPKERVPKAYRVDRFPALDEEGFVYVQLDAGAASTKDVGSAPLPKSEFRHTAQQLYAYPYETFLDLLLDAPSAILDIPGLRICDDHRYGDPVFQDGKIIVEYAVDKKRSKPRTKATADYPYLLRLALDVDGPMASARLDDEAGKSMLHAQFGFTAWSVALTKALLRSTSDSAQQIGFTQFISADIVRRAAPYVSSIRRGHVKPPATFVA